MDDLIIRRPDDWHLHLRDGPAMRDVVGHSARQFARAIVMPNLKPPVLTVDDARAYRERILEALPGSAGFEPLMTLYLNDDTSAEQVEQAAASGLIYGYKLYPAGVTTNSDAGVSELSRLLPVLRTISDCGLVLQVHGEVNDADADIFEREALFVTQVLDPLLQQLPDLRVVLEHISTSQAAEFVANGGDNLAATITPQHMLFNRNELFRGGLRPHYYCLPILKAESHRAAVMAAAVSGNPSFFLGTDSAPHARQDKESDCGCAGIFSAASALELYAMAFEQAGALDRLEDFAAHFGADFYRLPRNPGRIALRRESWTVPESLPFGESSLTPLLAGQELNWRLATVH